jgi:hypothetical protein
MGLLPASGFKSGFVPEQLRVKGNFRCARTKTQVLIRHSCLLTISMGVTYIYSSLGNHQVEVQERAIRVLEVWLDPGLTWKEHIAYTTRKELAASEALSRIATLT